MSMGKITTHALDLLRGKPAAGLKVELWKIESTERRQLIAVAELNEDGRTSGPLLAGEELDVGIYELQFAVGDYFASSPVAGSSPSLFTIVPIRFFVSDCMQHYHVPLLAAPGGYSTYRGS
ncbi:hydroxyisourate hydrolase [Paenibacillus curdlanolyticus YK9]|uniref:5-hydroxyisourate hydrolase n=1 Tax=Paenibacillus curdlanolyticus YK9 TaxID=717606 RepID=E0IDR5_9BACL|nr:hydroxyisourate hydrolase [Paenibacillus curdlanolyticus]EFM09269.1 hydroxyisourate hydrolase [Paenibacillus curdlanolyticus YK9]